MEKKELKIENKTHCLVLTYPAIGHINPFIQFSKRLEHKGVKVTLVITNFIYNTINIKISSSNLAVDTISDGYDEGGYEHAESPEAYLERFREVGSQTLIRLIEKLSGSGHDRPVNCIVYDAFLPWALDVAKRFGLVGAVFFTQSCAVDSIYYHVNKGLLKFPGPGSESDILLPGLPLLGLSDLPSFVRDPESYPAFVRMVVDQFSNLEKADWVLCNTYYELEKEVVDWLRKFMPLRTIGPTIPSVYLDKRLEEDTQYGLSLYNQNNEACMKWLNSRPKRSVVYVSSGSLVVLEAEQMKELASALTRSNAYFLWVLRKSEEAKLPKGFTQEITTSDKGLVVSWCPQLEVLANDTVGCFVTHCGWNSTLEALSLGVPMVAIPQWSDQSTNAKCIMDVWKIGVRAPANERGIVPREALEKCLKEIMEGERGKEMKMNAIKWSRLAKMAVDEGGSSDKNIDEFIAKLLL